MSEEVLRTVLSGQPHWALAVSGGVDSMVLAHLAHEVSAVTVFHAVSLAVPAAATARVRRHASRHGWDLKLVDAAELADQRYRANPLDRCFHCKKNLYGTIRVLTDWPIASGTNRDDLDDFRPGLQAAAALGVEHPFVTAGIGKDAIYALAQQRGLSDLARLPPQPCLASRIETGVTVDPAALRFIAKVENGLSHQAPGLTSLRCRVTARGIVVECDLPPGGVEHQRLERWLFRVCAESGRKFLGFRPYRRGAAFVMTAP